MVKYKMRLITYRKSWFFLLATLLLKFLVLNPNPWKTWHTEVSGPPRGVAARQYVNMKRCIHPEQSDFQLDRLQRAGKRWYSHPN